MYLKPETVGGLIIYSGPGVVTLPGPQSRTVTCFQISWYYNWMSQGMNVAMCVNSTFISSLN